MMDEKTVRPTNLARSTKDLIELITKYPEYPIVILAGEDSVCGEYSWTYCSHINFGVTEIVDCENPDGSNEVCTDRDEFAERIEDWLLDKMDSDITEEEFQKALKAEIEKYEPYWKRVIAIYADN